MFSLLSKFNAHLDFSVVMMPKSENSIKSALVINKDIGSSKRASLFFVL